MENLVRALPGVELFLQLEGAWQTERLLTIADQNGRLDGPEAHATWQQRLKRPDPAERFSLMAETSRWLEYDDDVALAVYEAGLSLARQNVCYAELHVNPAHFTEQRWSVDRLLEALNDGRRRVEIAWKVKLRWVLNVFRDQPRHADDAVRLAGSAAGQQAGIVGMCLGGPEGAQPPGQFERAFRTAARKGIPTALHANGVRGDAASLREELELLQPQRLIGGLAAVDDQELSASLAQQELPVVVTMSEAVALGLVASREEYPLQHLANEGLRLIPSSSMPAIYGATLVEEQFTVVERFGPGVDELQRMIMNAADACWLPEDEKEALRAQLQERMAAALAEHPVTDD